MASNHPLPDGNKRASWACLVTFLDLNDVVWSLTHLTSMRLSRRSLTVAAHEVDEAWFANWLRQ
jgi:death-on-curing protein